MTKIEPHPPAPARRADPKPDPQPGRHHIAAEGEDLGERLDRMLARRLPGLSRSRLKGLIESGAVTCGGATIDEPSTRVKPGQSFTLTLPDAEPASPQAQAIPLTVLHEDAAVIVVDKPAGIPSTGLTLDDPRCVQYWLMRRFDEMVWAVHQLDSDTSGVNIFVREKPLVAGGRVVDGAGKVLAEKGHR